MTTSLKLAKRWMALAVAATTSSMGCVAEDEGLDGEAEMLQSVSTLAVPAPPADIWAESLECYGRFRVRWTHSAGATSYELHRISPLPGRIFSGAGSWAGVNVGNQPAVFASKACNAEGCSGFSPFVDVYPLPTCN